MSPDKNLRSFPLALAVASSLLAGVLELRAEALPNPRPRAFGLQGLGQDRDGDGKLSREEFMAISERLMRRDRNGDGVIDDNDRQGRPESAPPRGQNRRPQFDLDGDGRITASEISEALAARFEAMDRNADGFIDGEERGKGQGAAWRKGAQTETRGGGVVRAPRVDTAQRLDLDGDGMVSREEFLRRSSGLEKLDRDGDGVIFRAELVADRRRAGAAALRRFDRWDRNHDGRLTEDERISAAAERFSQLDSDEDGLLSQAELQRTGQGRAAQPSRAKMLPAAQGR